MSKTQSQRLAYGEEIVALGGENPNVVALEADLGKSTMSTLFQQAYPDRYFEMGIAEQDMLSTAAGLAASGKIPFCSTFAVFIAGRAFDQIRQTISIGKLNVKICGSSSGLSDFGDGATHQEIEDLALMSAIPNMTVLTPCDATETRQAVRAAAEIEGPVYIRVVRNDLPDFIQESDHFELGKLRTLKDGSDVAILAHGSMVAPAMKAADLLAAKIIKNHYAAEYIYNAYKDTKTCGVIEEDKAYGIKKICLNTVLKYLAVENPVLSAMSLTLSSVWRISQIALSIRIWVI